MVYCISINHRNKDLTVDNILKQIKFIGLSEDELQQIKCAVDDPSFYDK